MRMLRSPIPNASLSYRSRHVPLSIPDLLCFPVLTYAPLSLPSPAIPPSRRRLRLQHRERADGVGLDIPAGSTPSWLSAAHLNPISQTRPSLLVPAHHRSPPSRHLLAAPAPVHDDDEPARDDAHICCVVSVPSMAATQGPTIVQVAPPTPQEITRKLSVRDKPKVRQPFLCSCAASMSRY